MTNQTPQPFAEFTSCYLVGIKGVAMTSLAFLLTDLGKKVTGCDVDEDFVTSSSLKKLAIVPDIGFDCELPNSVDCVIYTAAHNGKANTVVQQALKKNVPVLSHAEAVGLLSEHKETIAVCGVGGKSTVSAMITWTLESLGESPSYSVGVGSIIGLAKTGNWNPSSKYFVVEADEYVTNPEEVKQGGKGIPRFSYLHPTHIVCTNIHFDHPDVYASVEETHTTYRSFFNKLPTTGTLVFNQKDSPHIPKKSIQRQASFGSIGDCDYLAIHHVDTSKAGITTAEVVHAQKRHEFTLTVPGRYNVENAVATIAVLSEIGYDIPKLTNALHSFSSTQRRFEHRGVKDTITYYDDYAHHPSEIAAVLSALKDWYPNIPCVIAFQPHTFSRTKELFAEFVASLEVADNLVLLDIFASARENFDDSISSKTLATAIEERNLDRQVTVLPNYQELAKHLKAHAPRGCIVLTIGAGDIYKVHDLV